MEIQILVSTLETPIHKQFKSLIHLLLVKFLTFLEKCSWFDLILELLDRAMRILERVQPFLPHLNFEFFFGFYLIM